MRSICLLTGHTFGTDFEKQNYGHSWSTIEYDDWGPVLNELNVWAANTFGADALDTDGGGDYG